jgi:hypothetical protein
MRSRVFSWAVRTTVILGFAVGVSVLAQDQNPVHFGGVINDFTSSHDAKGKLTGPWVLHVEWAWI